MIVWRFPTSARILCALFVFSISVIKVFTSVSGTKIGKRNLRRAFTLALKRADVNDFTWHCLRHSFASRLAQEGVDVYKISKLLNHKSLKSSERYMHHCPESLRSGVEVLEKVDYNLTTI